MIKNGYSASRTSAALVSCATFMRQMNSECLTRIFIHHGEHFIRPAITQLVMYKIDSPLMVRPIGSTRIMELSL